MILRIAFVYIIYVVIIGILFVLRPSALFDEDGNIRQLGFIDEGGSMLSLYVILPVLAITIYIVFLAWTR